MRPSLERLEDRLAPATDPFTVYFAPASTGLVGSPAMVPGVGVAVAPVAVLHTTFGTLELRGDQQGVLTARLLTVSNPVLGQARLSGPIRTISATPAALNQYRVFVSVDPVPGPVALGVRLVTTRGVGFNDVQLEITDLSGAVEETHYAPPLRIYSASDTRSDDTTSTGAEAGHALRNKVNGTAPIPLGPMAAVPVVNAIGAVAPERIGLAPVEKVGFASAAQVGPAPVERRAVAGPANHVAPPSVLFSLLGGAGAAEHETGAAPLARHDGRGPGAGLRVEILALAGPDGHQQPITAQLPVDEAFAGSLRRLLLSEEGPGEPAIGLRADDAAPLAASDRPDDVLARGEEKGTPRSTGITSLLWFACFTLIGGAALSEGRVQMRQKPVQLTASSEG